MYKKTAYRALLILAAVTLFTSNSSAQAKKQIAVLHKAFKNKKMLNGTLITPDSSIDAKLFAKEYNVNKVLWEKAFSYLTTTDLDTILPGKHLIAGDSLYAVVVKGATKTPDIIKWESHKTHIDIQCVITGAETMQLANTSTITPTIAYDPKPTTPIIALKLANHT